MNRTTHTFLAALCGLIGTLALGACPASATNSHVQTLQSAPFSQAKAFGGPSGVAVDQETGNLYVLDRTNNVVDIFGGEGGAPTGGAPTQIVALAQGAVSLAVDSACWHHQPRLTGAECEAFDPSNGDVYVANVYEGTVYKYRLNSVSKEYEAAGTLEVGGEVEGVAVDDEGNVYVAGYSFQTVFVFDAAGSRIGEIEQSTIKKPGYVAVGKPGVIYLAEYSGGVARIEAGPTGSLVQSESMIAEAESGKAVAVNEQGSLYSDSGSSVREFDSAGTKTAEFGAGALTGSRGVAVDDESDYVYATDSGQGRVVAFKPAVVAEPNVGPVSSFPSASSAVLEGTVNPDGTTVSGCEFEYGTTPGVYSGKAPCSPSPPLTGEQPLSVSTTIAGLTQGTTYYYRLSVTNENGPVDSNESKFFLPLTVKIEGESASFVETNAAMLEATVNPGGAQTAYHFEYGKSAGSYEASVPIPDRDIAAGLAGVRVSAGVVHLTPGTTYHYRVVASNGLPGGVAGLDQTFTTTVAEGTGSPVACSNEKVRGEQAGGLELPDCRAYEQVSPPDKNGNDILVGLARSSASGDAVTYDSGGSFAQPHGSEIQSRYISQRSANGWTTENISPPYAGQKTDLYTPFESLLFTPELSRGVLRSFYTQLPSGAPGPFIDFYAADFKTGAYEKINYVEPKQASSYNDYYEAPVLEGGSSDLGRVVFEQTGKLTAGAAEEFLQAYDWFEGQLHLLSISPSGTPFKGESFIGGGGGNVEAGAGKVWHAVSGDGRRVFFGGAEEEYEVPQLYLRENPEQPQSPVVAGKCAVPADACTVEVSASQREPHDSNGVQLASFAGASADGSRVFFTSRSELTGDAFTGGSDNASNLYEYDVETGQLHDLTVDTEDTAGAAVLDVVSAAEDGSYVYFVAEGGKLASNENAQSERAVTGKPNLFVYHAGQVRFIATLAGGGAEGNDSQDWNAEGGPLGNAARASADGTHLAFESVRSLTGYDNQPAKPGGCEGERCREVYLYDAQNERLVCASCDPNGARPVGPAELGGLGNSAEWARSIIFGPALYVDNNLSGDGSRLFFESPDPLVRSDSNSRRDVYEYENGRVRPVSDVRGGSDSFFLDASPSGNDVFIATADQLVGADRDGLIDVYDARIDGGFAEQAPPPECDNGDSCRTPISPQPGVYGAPSSATLAAHGNATPVTQKVKARSKPKPCRKGRKRKRGKCVRVKGKRSSKANVSSKRSSGKGK